ncbi:MAG TPA: hypothetical protein VMN60_07365 [Longimicrobiales bacterium]|nr:hypothetical protein [Longimicrobiales bacterium]
MNAAHALLRPAARPLMLLLALPLLLALGAPLDELSRAVPDVIDAMLHGSPVLPVRHALWQSLVLVPLALGVMAAVPGLDVQHTSLGWLLPDVRRAMLVATFFIGSALALVYTVLFARTGMFALLPVVFASGLFWFLLPCAVLDSALPRAAQWLGFAVGLAAAFDPDVMGRVAEAQPVAVGATAAALVAAMLLAHVSVPLARRRPWTWSQFYGSVHAYWARQKRRPRRWTGSLATDRALPWLRAAGHEASPSPYPRHQAMQALAGAAVAHAFADPMFFLLVAGMGLTNGGTQLSTTLTYPLSRARRADLSFLGGLRDAATVFGLAALALFTAQWLQLPALVYHANVEPWYGMVGAGFAFVPIAQWSTVLWGSVELRPDSVRLFRRVLPLAAYMVAAGIMNRAMLRDAAPLDVLRDIVITAAIVQLLHWLALRAFFARRNLRSTA